MFTGIAAAMGSVRRLTRRGEDALLEIDTSLDLDDVRIGDSIAVSGACLTVTARAAGASRRMSPRKPSPGRRSRQLKAGDRVNLEKALRVGDPLGGHIVLGHVDGVGTIGEKTVRSRSVIFGFEIDPGLGRYIVAKGSIAVDGISLTVNRCEKNRFYVNIIPHTAAGTTLGIKKVADRGQHRNGYPGTVSGETDLGGEGTRRNLRDCGRSAGGIDLDMLARHGFLK